MPKSKLPREPKPHPSSVALCCRVCQQLVWATRVNSSGAADPDGELSCEEYKVVCAAHTDALGFVRCKGSGERTLFG